MAAINSEYKLNYSGEEINAKLGKIDQLLPSVGGTASNLKIVYSSILSDDNAVSVKWVNTKLLKYLSTDGNSIQRPISGDIYLNTGTNILNKFSARALFTYDLANWAGYAGNAQIGKILEITEAQKDNKKYVALDSGVWILEDALTGNLSDDEYRDESKVSEGQYELSELENGKLKNVTYKLPKYRFAHLTQFPRHLKGNPQYQSKIPESAHNPGAEKFETELVSDARYGFGIDDVYFKEQDHDGPWSSVEDNKNLGKGKFTKLTLGADLNNEGKWELNQVNLANAATTLAGYNITDAFIGNIIDDEEYDGRTHTQIHLGNYSIKVIRPGDIYGKKHALIDPESKQELTYTTLKIAQNLYGSDESAFKSGDLVHRGTSLAAYDIRDTYLGKKYKNESKDSITKAGKITIGGETLYVLRPGDITLNTNNNYNSESSTDPEATGVEINVLANSYDDLDETGTTFDRTFVLATKGNSINHYGITDAKFVEKYFLPDGKVNPNEADQNSYDVELTLTDNVNILRSNAIKLEHTTSTVNPQTGLGTIHPYETLTVRGHSVPLLVAPGISTETASYDVPTGGSLQYYGIEDTFTAAYLNKILTNTKIKIVSRPASDENDLTSTENPVDNTTSLAEALYESSETPSHKTDYSERILTFDIGKIQAALKADKADKLTTVRSFKVDLSSESSIDFDGSTDADDIGVSGTLSVEHGGTGKAKFEDYRLHIGAFEQLELPRSINAGDAQKFAFLRQNANGNFLWTYSDNFDSKLTLKGSNATSRLLLDADVLKLEASSSDASPFGAANTLSGWSLTPNYLGFKAQTASNKWTIAQFGTVGISISNLELNNSIVTPSGDLVYLQFPNASGTLATQEWVEKNGVGKSSVDIQYSNGVLTITTT